MTTTKRQNWMTQHRSKLDDDKKSKIDHDDKEKTIRSLRAHTGQLCASPWAGQHDSKAEKKNNIVRQIHLEKVKILPLQCCSIPSIQRPQGLCHNGNVRPIDKMN